MKTQRVAMLASLCLGLLLLRCGSGQSSDSASQDVRHHHGGCASNQDCASNKVCSQSVCRLPCAVNNDCQTGLVCIEGGCKGCTADGQCNAGDVCNNYLCSAGAGSGCQSDADCASGQVCTNGTCGTPTPPPPPPPPAQCQSNTDCSNGQVCVSGSCQACTNNNQCASGQVCSNGACGTPTPPPPPPPPAQCQANTDCSNGQVCVSGSCQACTNNNQCVSGQVCSNGACGTPTPPPPPPPNGGCVTESDCANGGLCESGSCVASACDNRASGKTGIRATVQITRYQGIIHGRNGDHEIAFGTLTNVSWIYNASTEDTTSVQLAMNVASSTDPTGLPHEIPLTAGESIDLEGEYISAASAGGSSGNAVIHFTHSTCGYVTINGSTYQ